MGEKLTVTIVGGINRVQNPDGNIKFNYKGKNETQLYYYDVMDVVTAEGEEKQLLINIWVVYFLLKFEDQVKKTPKDLDIGDDIEINHISKREYTITKK